MTGINFFGIILFAVIVYFMMKKGGGCCGGHDHSEHENKTDHNEHENKPLPPLEHHHEQQRSNDTGRDPVCGMDVNSDSPTSEHRGKTFRFCSEQCRKLFDLNPHKYANL